MANEHGTGLNKHTINRHAGRLPKIRNKNALDAFIQANVVYQLISIKCGGR